MLDAVRRAIAAGELRAVQPGDIAVSLWAIAHGMVSLELRGYLPPDAGDPARLFGAAPLGATLDGWRP